VLLCKGTVSADFARRGTYKLKVKPFMVAFTDRPTVFRI
jgi:hypothetical protein